MTRISTALVFATIIVIIALPRMVDASPLDLTRIPADALGVGHVDVEALRKTPFFELMGLDKPNAIVTGDLAPIADKMVASCLGVSLWVGDKLGGNAGRAGTVLVEFPRNTKLASELVDTTVKRLRGIKTGDWYSITANKDTFHVVAVGNLLLLTDDPASMRRTMAVLKGDAKPLTEKALPGGSIGHGVFIFAALGADLLKDVKEAAGSTLLKTEMTSLVVDIGQIGADLSGRAFATTSTAEEAQKVKTVLDGLIALISLADEAKPLQPIERYFNAKVNGTTVSLTVNVPVVEQLLTALAKKH